jgi:non-heme chloroperoxidase
VARSTAWTRGGRLQVSALALASLIAPGRAQEPASWHDPSKHRVQFVTVQDGVRLEVLDWGGTGRSVVLLAGSGNTAHVYDDFAPKLSECCHVYAITRRGFGLSSHPDSGYTDQRLADDVLQVLDSRKVESPVLVGHSMAGSELTTLGAQHSDRLSGLVYLDAGADPKDFPWSDPAFRAVVQKLSPATPDPPSPTEAGRKKSYQAFRTWQMATLGFAFCESEVRNMYDFNSDGSVGDYRTPDAVHEAINAGAKKRDYSKIRVPVLSIFATPPSVADQLKEHPRKDAEERVAIEQQYAMLVNFIGRYKRSLQSAVPDARVLEWPGAKHYLFITNEADVLRELRVFLAGLH